MQTDIIPVVRQMIGDTSGTPDFADQDIQNACDEYRLTVRYELLTAAPDIQPPQGQGTTAQFVWATYFSEYQYWEADEVLQGTDTATFKPWVLLTPVATERIAGKWTFAVTLPSIATPPSQFPPVYATGKVYDLNAVAATLLERRIAKYALTSFDFTADGRQMRLGQTLDRLEKLRAFYLAKSWTRAVELVRTDLAPETASRPAGMPTDTQGALLPGVLSTNVQGARGGGY